MATIRKTKFKTNQLVLVIGAVVVVGIVATISVFAKGTSVQVFGASTCPGGVWTVDARINSLVKSSFSPVDIFDTDASTPSGYRLLKKNVELSFNIPYTFQYTPITTDRKDSITLFPTSSLAGPAGPVIGTADTFSVCPSTSGRNR